MGATFRGGVGSAVGVGRGGEGGGGGGLGGEGLGDGPGRGGLVGDGSTVAVGSTGSSAPPGPAGGGTGGGGAGAVGGDGGGSCRPPGVDPTGVAVGPPEGVVGALARPESGGASRREQQTGRDDEGHGPPDARGPPGAPSSDHDVHRTDGPGTPDRGPDMVGWTSMRTDCDVVVIGAGIIGLATARALAAARPDIEIVVVDKEHRLAAHQTGRNSGVIHSGIYYRPGSAKALLTRRGRQALLDLCVEHGVAHEVCGKVIVAADETEEGRLPALLGRAHDNGVEARMVDGSELRAIEPHVAGRAAIHVADAGIVDFVGVACVMADELRDRGHSIELGWPVESLRADSDDAMTASGPRGSIRSRWAVNCAGLHSDRLMATTGVEPDLAIVPFRGEVLRARPRPPPSRAPSRLSRTRSRAAVPRRALHPDGRRWDPLRPERPYPPSLVRDTDGAPSSQPSSGS